MESWIFPSPFKNCVPLFPLIGAVFFFFLAIF
jgi:hypothetical protein